MELEEWIEQQKDIDPKFQKKALCRALNIHPASLARLLSKKTKPSFWTAVQIEKITKGAVKARDIVTEGSKKYFCVCGRRIKRKNNDYEE